MLNSLVAGCNFKSIQIASVSSLKNTKKIDRYNIIFLLVASRPSIPPPPSPPHPPPLRTILAKSKAMSCQLSVVSCSFIYFCAFGHTIHDVPLHWWITRIVHALLILTEILAACLEYLLYIRLCFLKWCVWLTVEHGHVIRKWLHPILQQQLHWVHPARRETKTNSRNFHFNKAYLIFWGLSQMESKAECFCLCCMFRFPKFS